MYEEKQGSPENTGRNTGGGRIIRKATAVFLSALMLWLCGPSDMGVFTTRAFAAGPAAESETTEVAVLLASGRRTAIDIDVDVSEPDGGFPDLDPQSVEIPRVRPRTITGSSRVTSINLEKSPFLMATKTSEGITLTAFAEGQYDLSLWSADACLVRTLNFGAGVARIPGVLLEDGQIRAILMQGDTIISINLTSEMTGTSISLYTGGTNRLYANPTPATPAEGIYTLQGNARLKATSVGAMTRLSAEIQSEDDPSVWTAAATTLAGSIDAGYRLDEACYLVFGTDFIGAPTYWVVTLAFADELLEGEFSMSVRTNNRISGGELVESHIATVTIDVNAADATSFLAVYAESGKMLGIKQIANGTTRDIDLEQLAGGGTTKAATVKIFLLGEGYMPLLPEIETRIR